MQEQSSSGFSYGTTDVASVNHSDSAQTVTTGLREEPCPVAETVSAPSPSRPINPHRVARVSRALPGISSPRFAPISRAFLALRQWYWNSALRLLIAEIRALGPRIRWVLEIREAELLRGKETILDWIDGCAVGGPRTGDYIVYMQQVTARYPFLSIFDNLLLTEAWKAGLESGARADTAQNQVDIENS